MSHPAILVSSQGVETVQTKLQNRNGTTTFYRSVPVVREMRFRQEPASTRNPIRKDGTRAPSAYSIDKLYFACRSTPCETFLPPGQPNAFYNGKGVSQVNPWGLILGSGQNSPKGTHSRFHDLGFIDQVKRKAQVEFLNKLADASGKDSWALGVAAGEFRETCGMASELATGLVAGVRSIARSVKKSPKLTASVLKTYGELGPKAALRQLGGQNTSLLEAIVQGWLVKQFGIDPLVSDLFNASVQLQAKLADPVKGAETFVATIRGGASDKLEWSLPSTQPGFNHCYGFYSEMRVVSAVKVSFAARYRIPVKPTVNQRLGLYNPVHLTAQLTRFSWMADYVTNLSGWLRAMMAGQDCRFIEGTRSLLSKTTGNGGHSWPQPGFGYSVLTDPVAGNYVLSSDKFERTLLPIVGVLPSFLPGVKNQLNVNKLANSIAALTTLVGARSRPGPPVIKY